MTIGSAAVMTLLDGAKFLYRSGFDHFYMKSGGFQKAADDFDLINTGKKATILPAEGHTVERMTKVGDRRIVLREDNESGLTILQITQSSSDRFNAAINSLMDKIIIYTD